MRLFGTAALGALATAFVGIAEPAYAQDTSQGPEASAFDDIVVTARRREEQLQEVPIAVTALSSGDLREADITRIENLGQVVAGLTISTTNNRPSVPGFAIRGQRNDAAFITNDPSVGIYVAEAVQARVFGLAQSLFDLESVQVLKGPQGTLFGRNTTGGAILFQPQRPVIGGGVEGYVYGRLGDYERADFQGALSLPVGDQAAVRLAFNRTQREGYIEEVALGQRLNGEDTISGRVVFLLEPTSTFSNTLYVDYFESDQTGPGTRLTEVRPTSSAQTTWNAQGELDRQNATFSWHQVESDIPIISTGSNFGFTNVTEVEISPSLSLKNIFNFCDIDMVEIQDLDGTVLPLLHTDDRQQTVQFSNEIQLQGQAGSWLDWILGAYHFREDGTRQTLTTALGGTPSPRAGESLSESNSIFAQGDFGLTDTVTLTLGWRYTWDTRDFSQQLRSATTGACIFCDSRSADFSASTYTVNLSWQASPDHLLYAATRTGFRAGGFNSSGNNAAALEPFEPEYVTDFELGFKGDWYFGEQSRLRSNIAIYHTEYEDIQRAIIGQVMGVPVTSIFNAAEATIDGAEVELTFIPMDGVELIATSTWTDAQYENFVEQTAGGPVDRSMNEFAYVPEWTYRLGARWRLPFAFGAGSETWVRADYIWQDDIYHTEFNETRNFQEAYGLLSARLDFENIGGAGFDFGIWGRNLTDEEYYLSTGDSYNTLGLVYRGLGEPRMVGVDIRKSF